MSNGRVIRYDMRHQSPPYSSPPTRETGLPPAFFDAIREAFRVFRARRFTRPEPGGKAFVVDEGFGSIEALLGARYYAPNWQTSYHYRGETLNLARVEYDYRELPIGPRVWWQTHVRGWENPDGSTRLRAHWELEPTEHSHGHLDGAGLDVQRGFEKLGKTLRSAGVTYWEEDIPSPDSG